MERLQRRAMLDPQLASTLRAQLGALEAANRQRADDAEASVAGLDGRAAGVRLAQTSAACTDALLGLLDELEAQAGGEVDAGDASVWAAWAELNAPAGLDWAVRPLVLAGR
jgi:hypothetical protein